MKNLGETMDVTVNGTRLFYEPVGSENNYPLIVLHGGPGLDHTEMTPWMDSLSDMFRLLYVDQRGQGRSERVDPATLTLPLLAADASGLAAALGLQHYALLGHSYGAFVALTHAIERGDASHYIISHGVASGSKMGPEVTANLASFEPVELREQVTQSWAMEASAKTQEDMAQLMKMQMPFHFASVESEGYRRYMSQPDRTVYSPEVLSYAAEHDYEIEYEDQLGKVQRPTLIFSGEFDRTCTPRAARDIHAGIAGSELVILPNVGHMSYIEDPEGYFGALRGFFERHPLPA